MVLQKSIPLPLKRQGCGPCARGSGGSGDEHTIGNVPMYTPPGGEGGEGANNTGANNTGTNRKNNDEYTYENDSITDVMFIGMCRLAYGKISGFQSSKSWWNGKETFAGMIEVSRSLMKGKRAKEQYEAVIEGFPEVPDGFRALFPYSTWGAELNAAVTPIFFKWLVGPMERIEVEVEVQDVKNVEESMVKSSTTSSLRRRTTRQRSGVKIERCRYLAESGCTGMCVNLCKIPTQTFFTEQLGMPLYMEPNFEDFSCTMIFGQAPPSLEDDPVMTQPCLSSCPSASGGSTGRACHALLN